MRKIFFTTSIILFFLLVSLIVVLSTIGFETDRFNKFISNKITEKNKKLDSEYKRITEKLKADDLIADVDDQSSHHFCSFST